MLKIRRPLGRLIFNMGIAIPGKTVFLIETAPWYWNFPNKESILELDCHTVSLAAGWNGLTFELNWKTALCMLADMGHETVLAEPARGLFSHGR